VTAHVPSGATAISRTGSGWVVSCCADVPLLSNKVTSAAPAPGRSGTAVDPPRRTQADRTARPTLVPSTGWDGCYVMTQDDEVRHPC